MIGHKGGGGVEFRVLGPVEALIDGRPVDLGPPKRRLLLALLLLEGGRPVSVERLAERLWPEPPPAARRVVFAHVARLRKALARAAEYGVELVTSSAGYALRVDPDSVDVHRFRRLITTAATVAANTQRSELLHEALGLWRGPALGNLAAGSGAPQLARCLEDVRLNAIEDRVEADLAAGLHTPLISELILLVAEHPLRERTTRHLMLALYRCGDTSAALNAYRRTRADLIAELGIDPGPELTALHEAVLRRDPALTSKRPDA
ncbi:MAG: BTAD domain-containing putative transcriptional regulator [Catenulispora sp.]